MIRIVIIDDDLDVLETLGLLLEHEGFEIHAAEGVEDGLEMIEQVGPDLVLLDLVYPQSATLGLDTARVIKERHPRLPLFVLSSIHREYALEFSREELHADEFITKPARIDRLVQLIRRHVPAPPAAGGA